MITLLIIAVAAGVFALVQPHSSPESGEFLLEQATIPCEVLTGQPLTIDEIRSGVCDDDNSSNNDANDEGGTEFAPDKHVYLSLLIAVFLHGSVIHLLGNLWILWIFGNNVEDDLGSARFALFYLAAGLAASIGHVIVYRGDTTPVVGASGAIAGVMGAYLVLHPWAKVVAIIPPFFFLPFRLPAAVFLVIWFALQFMLANTDTNIAWEAHVVGFAFGVGVATLLRSSGVVDAAR